MSELVMLMILLLCAIIEIGGVIICVYQKRKLFKFIDEVQQNRVEAYEAIIKQAKSIEYAKSGAIEEAVINFEKN